MTLTSAAGAEKIHPLHKNSLLLGTPFHAASWFSLLSLEAAPSSLSLLLFAARLATSHACWPPTCQAADLGMHESGSCSHPPGNPLGSWIAKRHAPLLPPLAWDRSAHAQTHGAQRSPPGSRGVYKITLSAGAEPTTRTPPPPDSQHAAEPRTHCCLIQRKAEMNAFVSLQWLTDVKEVFPVLSHP